MTDLVTRDEAAALVGVRPNTWSAYVSRGQAPAPVEHVGRTPLWSRSSVERWQKERPGPGRPPKATSQGEP